MTDSETLNALINAGLVGGALLLLTAVLIGFGNLVGEDRDYQRDDDDRPHGDTTGMK